MRVYRSWYPIVNRAGIEIGGIRRRMFWSHIDKAMVYKEYVVTYPILFEEM